MVLFTFQCVDEEGGEVDEDSILGNGDKKSRKRMRNKNKKRGRFDEDDDEDLLSKKRRRAKGSTNGGASSSGVSDKSPRLKRQMKKLMDVIITYQDRYVLVLEWRPTLDFLFPLFPFCSVIRCGACMLYCIIVSSPLDFE